MRPPPLRICWPLKGASGQERRVGAHARGAEAAQALETRSLAASSPFGDGAKEEGEAWEGWPEEWMMDETDGSGPEFEEEDTTIQPEDIEWAEWRHGPVAASWLRTQYEQPTCCSPPPAHAV